ncbi:MAG: alpha/beta hydrolase [Elusimicrobia bacterium]|nr:alpha/beta hydrolase [Elusimicrobiota bacterium]
MRQAKLCAFLLGALFLAAGARAAAGEAEYKPASRFYYSEKDFLNYETAGSGPATLVFLHGFGASLHVWDGVVKYLPKDRFTAYLLDLKGAGFSSRPRDGRYSIRDNADLVNKFIKANNLSGYTLVAHSFGGAVALFSAIDSLEDPALKPGKLVLIDPAAYPAKLPGYIRALRIPGLRNILYSLTTRVFQVRHILGKVIYDRSVITEELVRRYTAFMGQKNFAYALWRTADQMVPEHPEQYTSRYKDLKYPALVIWGKEDRVLRLAAGERLAKDLPAAQLAVLAKCGHDAPEEFPEGTARLIETFAVQ